MRPAGGEMERIYDLQIVRIDEFLRIFDDAKYFACRFDRPSGAALGYSRRSLRERAMASTDSFPALTGLGRGTPRCLFREVRRP
jgi:hypothetical protein